MKKGEISVLHDIVGVGMEMETCVVPVKEEEDYGVFPAKAVVRSNGTIDVISEKRTLSDLTQEYCGEFGLRKKHLEQMYVQSGITQAILIGLLNPAGDVEYTKSIHEALSSPDSLARQVLDSNEVVGRDEELLLLALHQGWVAVDLATLNAGRLAVTVVGELLTDEVNPLAFKATMGAHIQDTMRRWEPYRDTVVAFQGDVETAAEQFANTIPAIEIMGAFPMPVAEAEKLVTMMAGY